MSRLLKTVAIVGSLAVGLASQANTVSAQSKEKCFGVALAGQNDGLEGNGAGDTGAGTSTKDYQGNAWALVDAGSCTDINLPPQPDGTPRNGALEPLSRDLP